MNYRTIGLFLCAIACVLLLSCRSDTKDKKTVTAAFVPAGYYLPFLVMEHDRLLEKRGYALELKQFNDNAEMVSMFLNGHLDVTAQSALTIFPVEIKHPGLLKFVYGQYGRSYFFVVPTTSQFKQLQDLKGTTIGTWKSPTAALFIKLILKQAGLGEDDYKLQRYDAAGWGPALENGTIQVAFGFDILAEQLVSKSKYRYLDKDAVTRVLPERGLFNGGAFISTKVISEAPAKAKAIRDALFEALETIHKEPDRVATIMAQKFKVDIGVAQRTTYDDFEWPNDNLLDAAKQTLDLLRHSGVVEQDLDPKQLFWSPSGE